MRLWASDRCSFQSGPGECQSPELDPHRGCATSPPLPSPPTPSQLSRPDSLFLTWPKGSRWLFVSFSFWKETSCRIQWAPVAGESGWT